MKNPAKVLLSLFMLLPLLGCSELDEVTDPSGVTVSGRVVQDGSPLSGASITVDGKDISVTSDQEGQFSISLNEKGTYRFVFTKQYSGGGLVDKSKTYTVNGDTEVGDVELPVLGSTEADDDPFTRTVRLEWNAYTGEDFLKYELYRIDEVTGEEYLQHLKIFESDNAADTSFVDGAVLNLGMDLYADREYGYHVYTYMLDSTQTDTTVVLSNRVNVTMPRWDDSTNFAFQYSLTEINRFSSPRVHESVFGVGSWMVADMATDGEYLWIGYQEGIAGSAPVGWTYALLLYEVDLSTGETIDSLRIDDCKATHFTMRNGSFLVARKDVGYSELGLDGTWGAGESIPYPYNPDADLSGNDGPISERMDFCSFGDSLIIAQPWEKLNYFDPATGVLAPSVLMPFEFYGGLNHVSSSGNEIWAGDDAFETHMVILNRRLRPIGAVPTVVGMNGIGLEFTLVGDKLCVVTKTKIIVYQVTLD